jgi:hypothetical protein
MIVFPSEIVPNKSSSTTKTAGKYYPSFDPTALDGFYAVFNRPYTSNYSYDGNPEHGDNYKPPVKSSTPEQVFYNAMNGDSGDGMGLRGGTASGPSIDNSAQGLVDSVAQQNTGFLSGMPGEENGFSTTVGDLSVAAEGGKGYGRGIGGMIGMVNDAIGLISGLVSSNDSSDGNSNNADAGYNGGMGGYDSSGYDSPGTGSGDPGDSSDSSNGSSDSGDSGDSGSDSGDGDSGGDGW